MQQVKTDEKENKNYQTALPCAFQKANHSFYDLIARDNTRLPAQTRKTIPPTVKNGYIVHEKIEQGEKLLAETWTLRCGSLVYIGKGEKKDVIKEQAKENINQLQNSAASIIKHDKTKEIRLNLITLLTNAPMEKQNKILKHIENVVEEINSKEEKNSEKIIYSNLATNFLGMAFIPTMSKRS